MSRDCRGKTHSLLIAWLSILTASSAPASDLGIREVVPGLYYGASPKSDADFRQLQGMGIRTVVVLRKFFPGKSEAEQSQLSGLGISCMLVPMGFRPTRDGMPEIAFQAMDDPSLRPMYVHCALGRDRTGLVVALYRVRRLGWSAEAAYAAMQSERFNRLLLDLDRYFWLYCR